MTSFMEFIRGGNTQGSKEPPCDLQYCTQDVQLAALPEIWQTNSEQVKIFQRMSILIPVCMMRM